MATLKARLCTLAAIAALGTLATSTALAWGTEGHQTVALLAEKDLSPTARAEVNRLLALEPGATLASISTWADEHRSPQTAAWHYVNFPQGDCSYQVERDCPERRCVVAAIARQAELLGSTAPDDVRLRALKYLVHFVGDVHQPLHAGYKDDKGGNTYQLQAFMRGSNLHAVWDSGLIKNLNEDADVLAKRLHLKTLSGRWMAAQAAEESCRIVGTSGFYPGRLVDARYITEFTPIMEQRLALAGSRLAQLLNGLLNR